jgi:hypothetical protein
VSSRRPSSPAAGFLAPIYIGLAAGLLVLLVKFGQRAIALLTHVPTSDGDNNTIAGILALIGSLAVMESNKWGGHHDLSNTLDRSRR